MASQSLILQNPILASFHNSPFVSAPVVSVYHRRHHFLPRLSTPIRPPISLSVRNLRISANCTDLSLKSCQNHTPSPALLTGSTRTVTTLLAIALTASKFFAQKAVSVVSERGFQQALISTAGPAFFAAAKEFGTLNTPFTVVAAGMAKWLDIYSGVLMVRVLLSWFPNIPWDKQPLSAIRDLCDPYLNLFRNIIPPIFDTLDVSPLLAFAVLGLLASILNSSKGGY